MTTAIICTDSVSPTGCGHLDVTIGGKVYHIHQNETLEPLTALERDDFVRLGLRFGGLAIASLLHRVVIGAEATNVKLYQFFGPGATVTKTNIGTAYVNICPGTNGERRLLDLTGCTEFRLRMFANLIGAGAFGARIVRDSDDLVLFESANLGASGERELDSDWQPLPAAFLGVGQVQFRAQAKSTTAADDPVFRGLEIGLR